MQTNPSVLWLKVWRFVSHFLNGLLHLGKIKLGILVLFTLLLTALQFAFVQTFLAQKLTEYLSTKSKYPIQVGRVAIRWFDEAVLQDVSIHDQEQNAMIFAEKVSVNYNLFDLVYGRDIVLEDIHLANGKLHLIADSVGINLVKWIDTFGSDTTQSPPSSSRFIIEHARLDDMAFYYDDLTSPPVTDGSFDGLHLHFDNLSGDIYQLVVADDIRLNVKHLQAWESNSKMPIHELTARVLYSDTQMKFEALRFRFGDDSLISDTLHLNYANLDALADFNNQVHLKLNLDSTVLTYKDLSFFAPDLKKFKDIFIVSGKFEGKVSDFVLENTDFRMGRNTRLKGTVRTKGLPNIDSTFLDLRFEASSFDLADLAQYLGETYESLPKIGKIELDAQMQGFLADFQAQGNFSTRFGNLKTQLQLNTTKESYQAQFSTQNFDLGALLQNSSLQKLSVDGTVKGTGFSMNKADIELDAKVPNIGLLGYNYKNITADLHLSQQLFQGILAVQDSNFRFKIDADINLKDSTVLAKGSLDTLLLHKLGFSPQHAFARTRFSADFKGLTPDEAIGFVDFHNTHVAYQHKGLDIKKLALRSSKSVRGRSIILDSNLFRFKLNGEFLFSKLADDLNDLKKEYSLYFQNQDSLQERYYAQKALTRQVQSSYEMNGEFTVLNFDPILDLFSHETHIGKGTKIAFSFAKNQDTYVNLEAKIDTLIHAKNQIYGLNLSIDSHKSYDTKAIIGAILLTSDNQVFGDLATEKFEFKANLNDEVMEFSQSLKFKQSTDEVDINGQLVFDEHFYRLKLLPSSFNFMQQVWKNPESTEITIKGSEIHFQDLVFADDTHRISVEGDISENPEKKLNINIQDLGLETFNSFSDFQLKGNINGTAVVQSIYEQPKVSGIIKVDELFLDGFLMGSTEAVLEYDQQKNAFLLEADMLRNGQAILELRGAYHFDRKDPLDFHLELLHASLQIAEPFVKDNLSQLDGTMKGALDIKGSPSSPIVTGALEVFKGKLRVNLSNVTYHFSDVIKFEEDRIVMEEFDITDGEKGKARIEGGIYHDGFNDFMIQLKGTFKRFKALDTERSKEIYYGKAYLSGDFKVFGSLKKLDISGNIKTEKDTKVYMPLDGYADIAEQEDFIRFVPPPKKDSVEQSIEIPKQVEDELKMDMKFNVEITPQAYCEIIFDKKAGDIMRGNGKGKLRVEMSADGELKLFGDIEITKGAYNFTFLNVVNKEFTVGQGSHITWTGDPFEGALDIKAQYTQMASLAPILDNVDSTVLNRPEIRKRYPIRTDLLVTGKVLKPEIRFGIEILNYPATITAGNNVVPLSSYVAAFQTRLSTDDQELNRQVFSLMVLKQLSSADAWGNLGQSAGRSVSELLTNQLSSWMSQVDDKLEIGIDLNGLDADALKTFQLRLSYSFLGGRMRISRDGGFTNANNQASATSLIGDWTLEYLLTTDGKALLKMYHRNAVMGYNAGGLANNSVAGVSLLYTRSFNNLSELLNPKNDKED